MNKSVRHLVAVFVAAAGIAFAIMMLRTRQPAAVPAPAVVDHEGVEQLRGARMMPVASGDAAAREDLRAAVQTQVKPRIAASAAGSGLSEAQAGSLASIGAERLAIFAAPSWDAYARQHLALTGKDARELAEAGEALPEATWNKLASVFGGAEFDLEKITVRASVLRGEPAWSQGGGRLTTSTDQGGQYAGSPETGPPEEVWDVVVPIRLPKWKGSDGPIDLFLINSYRRRPSDGRWVPYSSGVYDPSGGARYLPTPWL